MEQRRGVILAFSIILFITSLTKECYCTTNQCGDSILVFLIGWLGVIFGGAALTWLANPLIMFSWILTQNKSKYALVVSALAALLCLSFLLFDTVIDNEAGHYNKIVSYKSGYWLWTTSAVIMVVGNVLLIIDKSKNVKH